MRRAASWRVLAARMPVESRPYFENSVPFQVREDFDHGKHVYLPRHARNTMANDDAQKEDELKKTVVVVGAGLVGAMTAVFLGRRGYKVGAADITFRTAADVDAQF